MHTLFTRSIATLGLTAVLACSSGGSGTFQSNVTVVRTASVSLAADPLFSVSGSWVAFALDEATTGLGADLNGDGDSVDSIAAVLDMKTGAQRLLSAAAIPGVAVRELAVHGGEAFLVVGEDEDGRDWDGDGAQTATVLLHSAVAGTTLTLVDTLDMRSPVRLAAAGGRLYYTAAGDPALGETSVRFLTKQSPTTPFTVASGTASSAWKPTILEVDEDLIMLALDEHEEGQDLNADGDADDSTVLALLDGHDPAAPVRNVGLALAGNEAAFRAASLGPSDWLVGFLVNEAAQGDASLNHPGLFPPTWRPHQCLGQGDGDSLDDVLHFLRMADWSADPAAFAPTNTGLAGSDQVVILGDDFVGTIAPEVSDDSCDLNQDGDLADRVARWTWIDAPHHPVTDPSLLVTLADVPGGTNGLIDMNGRLVAALSESAAGQDLDGDGETASDLMAWIDPWAPGSGWTLEHLDAEDGPMASNHVRVAAMTIVEPDRQRIAIAAREGTTSHNDHHGQDGDVLDWVPAVACFGCVQGGGTSDLDLPGWGRALDSDEFSGVILAAGHAYFRIDESEDTFDWNGDGDETDVLLVRGSLNAPTTLVLGETGGSTHAAIHTDGTFGAVFVVDEPSVGEDVNGDGDLQDRALGWVEL